MVEILLLLLVVAFAPFILAAAPILGLFSLLIAYKIRREEAEIEWRKREEENKKIKEAWRFIGHCEQYKWTGKWV